MKILIVENNGSKIRTFIDNLGHHRLTIVDDEKDAIECLETEEFDVIFLDNDLGDGGFGANVASYLFDNRSNVNNDAFIVLHSLRVKDSVAMSELLSNALIAPFDSEFFSYLGLDN